MHDGARIRTIPAIRLTWHGRFATGQNEPTEPDKTNPPRHAKRTHRLAEASAGPRVIDPLPILSARVYACPHIIGPATRAYTMIRFSCHCTHEFLVDEDQAGGLI